MNALNIIILAAGKSTRIHSRISKIFHPVGGLSLLEHCLRTAQALSADQIGLVVSDPQDPALLALQSTSPFFPAHTHIYPQTQALGTGDAVRCATPFFAQKNTQVLVLCADSPLVSQSTLEGMLRLQRARGHAAVVLGMEPQDPGHYGRLVIEDDGTIARIVEYADATPQERALPLCNAGVMLLDAEKIRPLLESLQPANAKGEYYLTDVIALAQAAGHSVGLVVGDENELLGVNSRSDLAAVEQAFQWRMRQQALDGGATLIAPETVFFAYDTVLEPDTTIWPHVTFGPGVSIETGAVIKPYCFISGTRIRANAQIGPFAHLRPGSDIGPQACVGNFVEIKGTTLSAGAAVKHLSYLGDAQIGERANIGAGTITCNYDGHRKHATKIGKEAFIGSHTTLIAPLEIGDRTIVGAGSVLTQSVPADALALARAPQHNIPEGARRYHEKRIKLRALSV